MTEQGDKGATNITLKFQAISREVAELLIIQSNAILDCIEKKQSIVEVTNISGAKIDGLEELRNRLRKLRR